MQDLIFFLLICAIFFFIGFPFTRLLPANIFKKRFFLSITFGFGITAFLVTILYKFGLSINLIFKIFAVISIILTIFFMFNLFRKIKIEGKDFFKLNKLSMILLLIWIIGSLVLIAPRIVGGDQFSVFQGNRFDNFTYLNSALVYSKVPYEKIINSNDNDFLKNPLLLFAKVNLYYRPSVHFIYSFVSRIFSDLSYKLHYTFQIFIFSQTILVFMFIIVNIIKNIFPIVIGLASLTFSLGFWGQYILDINAWSQISSIPIMLLIIGLIIILFGREYIEVKNYLNYIKIIVVFSLLFSCSLYLYPENLIFHLPLIFIISLFYFIIKLKNKEKRNLIFLIFIGIFFGLLSGFLFYEGTIKFVFDQLKFSYSSNVNWWKYFQEFLLGRDDLYDSILLNNIIDFISSLSGLYFITPDKNINFILSLIFRLLSIGFITCIIYHLFCFIKVLFGKDSKKENKIINKNQIISIIIIFFFLFGLSMIYNIFYNIKFASIAKTVSITINISDDGKLDDIYVYRVPPKSEIVYVARYYNHWITNNKYFKNILIQIPEKEVGNIKNVNIKIGNEKFLFTKEEFIKKWKTIEINRKYIQNNKNYFIYQSPDELHSMKSKIKQFSIIINWPGDNELFIKSITIENLIIILLTISAIIFSIKFSNIVIMSSNFNFFENKNLLISLLIICITGLVLIFPFLLRGNIWGAGKAFSYMSPYLILLIVLPLFYISKKKYLYLVISPIFIFIILQISFGFFRIYCSTHKDGIHYELPYPSIQDINLKKNINWNIDRIYPYIKDSKMIEVDIENRWLENYIFDYLYVKDKKYYSINVINSYYGRGNDLGYQKPDITPDILITQENNKLIIKSLNRDMIIYRD